MWKRALVHKLNTLALSSEILHGADAPLFTNFLSVHFFRSLPAPLSRFETDCFLILSPTGLTGWRCTEDGQFFEEVSFSSAADAARRLLASAVWLLNARARPRGTSMSCCQQSEFSPFCRDGGSGISRQHLSRWRLCEAHDSSTCFDLHSAVMCMEFALDIEYVPQHEQCLT